MPLSSLRVMLRLRFIQRIVNPLLPHERFMRASLCEPPAIQHDDPVAELAAAHAVGNVNCCFFADQCIEIFVDFRLCDRIERCGRLIQNDKRRVFVKRPCDRQLLFFPSGKQFSVPNIVPPKAYARHPSCG